MNAPIDIKCRACATDMGYAQEIADPTGIAKGVVIHVYQCTNPQCGRKAVVIYEPGAGEMTQEAKTFVEREVMRVGSFFPQDSLSRFGGGGRFGR